MDPSVDNQKFELRFSEKAVRNNTITVILYTVIIVPLIYVGAKSVGGWVNVTLMLILMLTALYSVYCLRRLVKGSYFEITSDGRLVCIYNGRAKIEYPIKEIINIEEATLKQAERKYARFPVVLNTRGEELYPSNGVLITFNRSWIKSVFPVYFNPADVQGFMSAIKRRMES
ncbi:MAG: hypothetical protein HDR96_08730 [Bacteroides sp.]|nr:hypothetical protein [Bacteroides sp.]